MASDVTTPVIGSDKYAIRSFEPRNDVSLDIKLLQIRHTFIPGISCESGIHRQSAADSPQRAEP